MRKFVNGVYELSFIVLFTFCSSQIKAQFILADFSKAHIDDRIDYIGSDGELWRATIESNNYFKVTKVGNHEDFIINYINYDGSHWTAKLSGDKFIHAPDGNWRISHIDTRMDYLANDKSKCSAVINGNGFLITNQSTGHSFTSSVIYYLTWDESVWTAELSKPKFIHWKGIAQPTTKLVKSINYVTWDGSKWSASIMKNGTFEHTDEFGVSHIDDRIVYLNYNATIWVAKENNQKFLHTPGSIPKNKTAWEKIGDVIKKIGIKGGFPEGTGNGSDESFFRGIIVGEDNGLLYYRPLDNLGICTNDLAIHPLNNIVSRSVIGSCLNLGQKRDIYLFRYKKK